MANGDSGVCAGVADAGHRGEAEGDTRSLLWKAEPGRAWPRAADGAALGRACGDGAVDAHSMAYN